MLIPVTCPLCRAVGAAPCRACIGRLRPADRPAPPPELDALVCLVDYDVIGAQLIAALKYRNARRLIPWLAAALATLVPPGIDAITWAPTTDAHRRRRGYDQAEILARATGRRCGIPTKRLIVRLDRRSQTGRSRHERLAGPRFVTRSPIAARSVAVIDDVVTTGATLSAGAAALRLAGVRQVVGITVANTRVGRMGQPFKSRRQECN